MKGEKVDLNSIKNSVVQEMKGVQERVSKMGQEVGSMAKERYKRYQEKGPWNPWIYIKIAAHSTAHATYYFMVRISIKPFTNSIYQYIASGNKDPKQYVCKKANSGNNK